MQARGAHGDTRDDRASAPVRAARAGEHATLLHATLLSPICWVAWLTSMCCVVQPIPDTKLGRAHTESTPQPQEPGAEHADAQLSNALRRLREGLQAVARDRGYITRVQLRRVFQAAGEHDPTCKRLIALGYDYDAAFWTDNVGPLDAGELRLFGVDDVEAAMKLLDRNGDGKISMREVEAWVEQEAAEIAARTFARFREKAPQHVDSVGRLLGNIFFGLEQNCAAQNVEFADIARTIPCETGYVGTVDTQLEEADKDYLREQGRLAVARFVDDLRGSAATVAPTGDLGARAGIQHMTSVGRLPGLVDCGP